MNAPDSRARNLDVWLSRDLDLATVDREGVAELVQRQLERVGYRHLERIDASHAIEVRAHFGTKPRALAVGLLPFGKHFAWGKRVRVQATIRQEGDQTRVSLQARPFMELFDESEVILLTQSVAEKASDEYLAARHLQQIGAALRDATNTPHEDIDGELPPKMFAADFATGLLLYFLESDATKKVVHVPPRSKVVWSCWAFVTPAIWFIWHEIWGLGIVVLAVQWALWKVVMAWPILPVLLCAAALFIALRVGLGRAANRIFYARYGRWPDDPKSTADNNERAQKNP